MVDLTWNINSLITSQLNFFQLTAPEPLTAACAGIIRALSLSGQRVETPQLCAQPPRRWPGSGIRHPPCITRATPSCQGTPGDTPPCSPRGLITSAKPSADSQELKLRLSKAPTRPSLTVPCLLAIENTAPTCEAEMARLLSQKYKKI